MANFLARESAQDFFLLTLRSYEYYIINESIFLERLKVLSFIGDPANEAIAFANEILKDCDWKRGDDDWSDDQPKEESSELVDNTGERSVEGQSDEDPGDLIFHFIIAIDGNDWKFNPFDDDWFPSVPHGHKHPGRPTDKLDPYLGWLYDKSKQLGRLKRKDIISLWNDERFRKIASRAIDYYLNEHRHYRGWRVPNPRLLPRRR